MGDNQDQIGVLTRLRHVTPGYGYIQVKECELNQSPFSCTGAAFGSSF